MGHRHPPERPLDLSPCHIYTSKEYICPALVPGNTGREGVPDVLITRDQFDRRSNCEVVEYLYSLLILNPGRTSC